MTQPRLFPCVRPYYQRHLLVERAQGCRIWDADGREFLDGYAGVASVAVGHAHPRVTERVREQVGLVHHTTMIYRTKPLLEYLEAIQKVLPDRLSRHFFVNSGSEAVDFACQVARAHRRKPLLIGLGEGFHGGSYLAKSVTGLDAWRPAYGGDPDVLFQSVPLCRDCHEAKFDTRSKSFDPLTTACSAACLDSFEKLLRTRGDQIAGILLEPILGVGGILVPARGYFDRIGALARTHGIDLIVDEVQTGFGRCGQTLFASERFGIEPDLMAMAKGIANGFPLGLISATEECAAATGDALHFSTFGGNPVSCAAACETLAILREERLPERAETVGRHFCKRLAELLADEPSCLEIRGLGLMIGIELSDRVPAPQVLETCYQKGLLVGIGGRRRNVIRIEPPLVFTEEDAETAARIIAEAIAASR